MRVLSEGRVRRIESEWRSMLARYERSGLPESAFCWQSKLSRNAIRRWRRRLSSAAVPSPTFVEWIVPSEIAEDTPAQVGGSGRLKRDPRIQGRGPRGAVSSGDRPPRRCRPPGGPGR